MSKKRSLDEQVERIANQMLELADDVEITGFSPETGELANAILWPDDGSERPIHTFFKVYDEGKNPKLIKLLRAAVGGVGRLSTLMAPRSTGVNADGSFVIDDRPRKQLSLEARGKVQPEVVAMRLRKVAEALRLAGVEPVSAYTHGELAELAEASTDTVTRAAKATGVDRPARGHGRTHKYPLKDALLILRNLSETGTRKVREAAIKALGKVEQNQQ